jgi:hypothetical protein
MSDACSICGPSAVCRSFALMTEPDNWRTLLNGDTWPGPPGAYPFLVTSSSGNNWSRVAGADGWSGGAWDLIAYNFGTRNPREVNWYLYHFVGCRVSVDGNKNLTFWNSQPGVIYTRNDLHYRDRPPEVRPPRIVIKSIVRPTVPKPVEPMYKRSLNWFGMGVQFGGMGVFDGATTVRAYMINAEDPDSRFFLDVDATRKGFGGGASGSIVYVFITGLHDPADVRYAPAGSVDFQLAVGGRWASFAKGLKMIPNMRRAILAARTATHIDSHDLLADLVTCAKSVIKYAGIDSNSNALEVTIVELPLGGGYEGSVYWETQRYRASQIRLTPEPGDLD